MFRFVFKVVRIDFTSFCQIILLGLVILFWNSNNAYSQNQQEPPSDEELQELSNSAFEWLNQRRAEIGLPALILNKNLQASASAHANYIVMNNSLAVEMHNETAGKNGFTGATPSDRMKKAGYFSNSTAENIAMTNYPDGVISTDNLIAAPFHRQAEFSSYVEAGNAMRAQKAGPGEINNFEYVYVINFGNPGPSDVEKNIIMYPAPEQKNAPIDWTVNEVPSPWPQMDGRRVGYPVSIGVGPLAALTVKFFSLIAVNANSTLIEGKLVTEEGGKVMKNFAFWIPLNPLEFNTTYQAQVIGTLNGKALDQKWQFTTLANSPLVLTPASTTLASELGSAVIVQISGGTNNEYKINEIAQSWEFKGILNRKDTNFIRVTHPKPDTAVIYRGATPCSEDFSSCMVRVSGSDSSGKKVSINLTVK